MPWYSVSHPQLEITATVDAPSTEKARTTFLDYLERNHKISRRQRQLLRQAMATKRIEEGEGYSDLELHYEYEHVPEVPGLGLGGPIPTTVEFENPPEQLAETTPQPQIPVVRGMSPIQELAVTGKIGG